MLTQEHVVERQAQRTSGLFYGKYSGEVTNNDDPLGLLRIMALVPGVMGQTEVGWARPAFPFLGDGHGLVMLPEIGSKVWIEFEAGNLDEPIWTGCFLAMQDAPPAPNGVSVRVIVSKNKHKVVLDDQSNTVTIEHGSGAKLEMTATTITLSIGLNKMVMGPASISFNEGVVKIGPGGVSLAQGAMTLGIPPT